MARVGWTDDVAPEAKARRLAAKPGFLIPASPVAKAQKNEIMPWATTHDEGSAANAQGGSANIQEEQVPLKLSATAKALAESLRKGSSKPIDEYGRRAPLDKATTSKDDDTSSVEMADKAEWSTADVNDLPDSAFLHVEDGGKKDEEGKTTPRDLRHFPVRGPDGKPDAAHVRNALGRIPQSNLPAKVKAEAGGAARKLLDDLNEGTEKAQWPSDFNATRKMASGKELSKAHANQYTSGGSREAAEHASAEANSATERSKVSGTPAKGWGTLHQAVQQQTADKHREAAAAWAKVPGGEKNVAEHQAAAATHDRLAKVPMIKDSVGDAVRDHTKEPTETERGKMYDGANPVRTA